jgi:HSP20 family protein
MTAGLIPAEELRKLQIRMNKLMEELGLDALGSRYTDELERIQKRMGDLMEEGERPNLKKGVIRPLADVHETDEAVVVTMDMPGVEKQDIDISVVEDELRVSAKRKSETEINEQDYHRRERTYTRFERRVLLPTSIKTEEARAALNNGVLQITLPKVSVITRRRIAID